MSSNSPAQPGHPFHCPGIDLASEYANGRRKFAFVDISYQRLQGLDLRGIEISDSIAEDVDFSGALLDKSVIQRTRLHHCRMDKASLTQARIDDLDGCPMRCVSGARFETKRMAKCDASLALFRGARWSDANITNCGFSGTDFTGAILCRTEISNCQMCQAIWDRADMSGARIIGGNLLGASFLETWLYRCEIAVQELEESGLVVIHNLHPAIFQVVINPEYVFIDAMMPQDNEAWQVSLRNTRQLFFDPPSVIDGFDEAFRAIQIMADLQRNLGWPVDTERD